MDKDHGAYLSPYPREYKFSEMRKHLKSLVAATFLLSLTLYPGICFGSGDGKDVNIVEKIERESQGNITIDIPPKILELILQRPAPRQQQDVHPGLNKLTGFRIQVFSDGRNQHSLEARAKARGNAILSRFPKFKGQIYTFSKSPNWYTRIGNFRTSAEATAALDELKRAFPEFSSEMRVVKSQIVVIK